MSEVGDAIEATFTTLTAATVTATVTAPGGVPGEPAAVAESPAASGQYPYQMLLTTPGMWQILFRASGTVNAVETFHVFADRTTQPPLATAAQVVKVFRPVSPAEETVITARLAQASRMLRDRFADLDARIGSGDLDPALAADAAVGMVLRVIRVPGALSGKGNIRSETTGPFRRDFTTDGATDTDMAVTAAEVALLAPTPTGERRKGAGTIRVQAGLAPTPSYGDCSVRLW